MIWKTTKWSYVITYRRFVVNFLSYLYRLHEALNNIMAALDGAEDILPEVVFN